jgi:hypothetical protein
VSAKVAKAMITDLDGVADPKFKKFVNGRAYQLSDGRYLTEVPFVRSWRLWPSPGACFGSFQKEPVIDPTRSAIPDAAAFVRHADRLADMLIKAAGGPAARSRRSTEERVDKFISSEYGEAWLTDTRMLAAIVAFWGQYVARRAAGSWDIDRQEGVPIIRFRNGREWAIVRTIRGVLDEAPKKSYSLLSTANAACRLAEL